MYANHVQNMCHNNILAFELANFGKICDFCKKSRKNKSDILKRKKNILPLQLIFIRSFYVKN
jgi:hypothetical protein